MQYLKVSVGAHVTSTHALYVVQWDGKEVLTNYIVVILSQPQVAFPSCFKEEEVSLQ